MVFPKRRQKKATARMWPEVVEEVAKQGVCFAMEDKLKSKNMEASHPKHLGKKTDEMPSEVSQIIPLNSAYERAGLTPPVPLEKSNVAMSHPPRKTPSDDDAADPLIGNRVAGYIVEESVSAGGMGVVYRARQPDIGRCVAIKVLRPEIAASEEQSNRFFKEAQALSAIRHRSVTDIIQWGRLSDRRQYIVMEYLEGDNLEDVMARDGAMPIYRVLSIVSDVLDALSAAHKAGVVHRDLKPSNIFIAKQSDGTQCVKLLDFGLARQVPVNALEGEDGKLEKASMVAGTPEYIAPEQAKGLAATPRTDIYSLGIVAFEMLAGKLPFHSQSTVEMMKEHAYKEAPDIRDFAENIPDALAELLASMLKKLPEERPRSTDEVKQRLRFISQQLQEEQTQVAVRVPQPSLEEPSAPATEKKYRKWWPIAALPIVAGLFMYVGIIIPGIVSTNNNESVLTLNVEVPQPTPPAGTLADATSSGTMSPGTQVDEPGPDNPTQVTTVTPSPGSRPIRTIRTKSSGSSAADPLVVGQTGSGARTQPQPAQPQSVVPVDCSMSASIWMGAMERRLSAYSQQLTARWGDVQEVRKGINGEFREHQSNIRGSDGSAATCEAISKDLDNWLRRYDTKPSSKGS